MAVRHTAATAVFCVLATSAWAERPVPASGKPTTPGVVVTDKSWPITLSDTKSSAQPHTAASTPTDSDPMAWSRQDIELAHARCTALLKGLDVVAVPESPLREGGQCGSAAPMKLISIGKGAQQVTFSPPPTVSCDLISGLARWLQQDLQGLARKHLGAQITRVETMSSYSCRNAYGRSGGRLSEHGRANALDISAFVTERNQMVSIEGDWGLTAREVVARKKEEDALRAQQQIKPLEPAPVFTAAKPIPQAPTAAIQPAPVGMQEMRPAVPGISIQFPSANTPSALGFGQPSRLGGPKTRNAPAAVIPPPPPEPRLPAAMTSQGKLAFLHAAHKVGCRTFGTVLGPEANKTHRNHFHVDMAERLQQTKVCE